MTQNKVMKLWTVLVTAFLALCTTLGFITTTAAAAVPQSGTTHESTAPAAVPAATAPWTASYSRALPPTMKQRIRAEAHGSSPSCRHRPRVDAEASGLGALCAPEAMTDHDTSLQHGEAPLQR
ncbi:MULTISPECIES: DUF6344 domain-containing protein [unclassified Streptomyces]|uniref:DUF6344 domain-containing protein n=1 Tax=unclassified Streptomyces TaxID=2593676 RepID=UPI00332C9C4C